MVFFAQKVLRKVAGNWTFVVVTDRVELDDQIAKTFKATGAVSEAEGGQCHAASGAHLRDLLRGNHRYVFTLIHKFQPERGLQPASTSDNTTVLDISSATDNSTVKRPEGRAPSERVMPVLCDRPDVIVLTDEAHRSQYDTLALNMRAALPKALFLAFTGTPLIVGEERTKGVFGDLASQARHQSVSPSYDSRSRALWSFPSTTSSNPTTTAMRSCSANLLLVGWLAKRNSDQFLPGGRNFAFSGSNTRYPSR